MPAGRRRHSLMMLIHAHAESQCRHVYWFGRTGVRRASIAYSNAQEYAAISTFLFRSSEESLDEFAVGHLPEQAFTFYIINGFERLFLA